LAEKLFGNLQALLPLITAFFFSPPARGSHETGSRPPALSGFTQGNRKRQKISSRDFGYHGVDHGGDERHGITAFWPMFWRQAPGIPAYKSPYPYPICSTTRRDSSVAAANLLEKMIFAEGRKRWPRSLPSQCRVRAG